MTQARIRSIGPEISEQTGNHLYKLRWLDRQWTYNELSLHIHDVTRDDLDGPKDISPGVLRNMEQGVVINGERQARRITVDEAVVLARVFDISVDKLVAGY